MKAIRLVKQFFLSRLTIKVLTIVLFTLLIYPPFKPMVDGLVKLVLLWGGIQIAADLLTKRACLRAPHAAWLLLLLLFGAVTILLNYPTGFKDNVSMLCYTALGMLVLYPNDAERPTESLLREMRIVGWVYIGLCTAGALLSLWMFAAGYYATFEYGGTLYHIGVYQERLYGVFSNPNLPACVIAVALCVLQAYVCREITQSRARRAAQYIVVIVCALANLTFAVMAQSRGSLLSLSAFIGVFLFFLFRKTVFFKIRPLALSGAASLLAAGILTVATVYLYPLLLEISSQSLTSPPDQPVSVSVSVVKAAPSAAFSGAPAVDPIFRVNGAAAISEDGSAADFSRPDGTDMTTGRLQIWKKAVEQFLKKPVWGSGNGGSLEGAVEENGVPIEHFHNLFLHSLAAGGVMGTLALAIVLIAMVLSMGKFSWKQRRTGGMKNGYIYAGMALFMLYMVNNLVEVYLIYRVSLPHFLFWIYMGYLLSLITQEEGRAWPDRLLNRLADRIPALGRKKGEQP